MPDEAATAVAIESIIESGASTKVVRNPSDSAIHTSPMKNDLSGM